mmetsp:Transcript_15950/g.40604  ORF Transcript_15950/g.40604 Transcript_15950/m.40604 type:complete len:277 (+) Transcript_15950:429-1259(+)
MLQERRLGDDSGHQETSGVVQRLDGEVAFRGLPAAPQRGQEEDFLPKAVQSRELRDRGRRLQVLGECAVGDDDRSEGPSGLVQRPHRQVDHRGLSEPCLRKQQDSLPQARVQPAALQGDLLFLLGRRPARGLRARPREGAVGEEGWHLRLRRLRPRQRQGLGHRRGEGAAHQHHVGQRLHRRRDVAQRPDLRGGMGPDQGGRPLQGPRLGGQVRPRHSDHCGPSEGEACAGQPAERPLPASLQGSTGRRAVGDQLRQDGQLGRRLGQRLADDVWVR